MKGSPRKVFMSLTYLLVLSWMVRISRSLRSRRPFCKWYIGLSSVSNKSSQFLLAIFQFRSFSKFMSLRACIWLPISICLGSI